MKQSFLTKITMRLYDTTFLKKLDDLYIASGERFESKNHFLTELIRSGFNEMQKEMLARHEPAAEKNDDIKLSDIKKLIEDLHIINKQHVQELLAHLRISEKLTSSIYNLVLALSEDERLSTAQLEAGFYDDLPERLVGDLREFLKVILKRQAE